MKRLLITFFLTVITVSTCFSTEMCLKSTPDSEQELISTEEFQFAGNWDFWANVVKDMEKVASSPNFDPVEFEKSVSGLADMMISLNMLKEAGLVLRKAFDIILKNYSDNKDVINCLPHLLISQGELNLKGGSMREASKWLGLNTDICMKTDNTTSDRWIRNEFDLSFLFAYFNHDKLALNSFKEGFDLLQAIPKDEVSPYTLNALLNAALMLIDRIDVDYFDNIAKLVSSFNDLPASTKRLMIVYYAYGLSHYHKDYEEALNLYNKVMEAEPTSLCEPRIIIDAAECAWRIGDAEYLDMQLDLNRSLRDVIANNLSSFSVNDTELYWEDMATSLNYAYGLGLNPRDRDPDDARQNLFHQLILGGAYINATYTKSLSVQNYREMWQHLKKEGTVTEKEYYAQILDLRRKIANETDSGKRNDYITKLNALEADLRGGFNFLYWLDRNYREAINMPENLIKGECHVEMLEYPFMNDDGPESHYGAVIAYPKRKFEEYTEDYYETEYEFVDLGHVDFWRMVYMGFGSDIGDRKRASQYNYDEIMSVARLMSPLLKKIEKFEKTYLSPVGLLSLINIGALPWRDDDHIVNDFTEVIRVYNAYEVSDIRKRDAILKSATVFGNMDYNNADNDDSLTSEDMVETYGYRLSIEKGNGLKKFLRLPIDSKALTDLLKSHASNVSDFTGKRATEEAFKALDGKATELIHIDTHGFYIPEGDNEYLGKHVAVATRERSLLTSGLAMAGANRAWSGEDIEPGKEDGILTAWEISCMDLTGCKLAVLSACDTAQGDISSIDGVLGLQRALKIAGVDAMLLTLWPVDNELTEEFMNDFYSRLPQSDNLNKAFIETQRDFRKRHADPYLWALFLLIN